MIKCNLLIFNVLIYDIIKFYINHCMIDIKVKLILSK